MMEDHEHVFTPETIDGQTEHGSGVLPPDEHRLVQDIYALSQAYARENERSLKRIWSRFVQSQEHPLSLQELPGDKRPFKERKTMQEKDISQERTLPTFNSQPVERPRRSIGRVLSMSAAVAAIVIVVGGWALFTNGFQHSLQSQTGSHSTQQTVAEKNISAGNLVCHFKGDTGAKSPQSEPTLSWSRQGQIATTYNNLKTFSAKDCAQGKLDLPSFMQATWSPDGRRLSVITQYYQAQVLDASTGQVISSLEGNTAGSVVNQSVWSSDGKQIISLVIAPKTKTEITARVQIWDANTGKLIHTALSINLPTGLGGGIWQRALTNTGNFIAILDTNKNIEIWNVKTGKRVSVLPYGQYHQDGVSALSWSSDGTSLAVGLWESSEVQIWSVADARLTTSWKDRNQWAQGIGALAWSPDGKYLAESTSAIHVWNVKEKAIVATFGTVDTPYWIAALTWSQDGGMLASSTTKPSTSDETTDVTKDTVSIWKLS